MWLQLKCSQAGNRVGPSSKCPHKKGKCGESHAHRGTPCANIEAKTGVMHLQERKPRRCQQSPRSQERAWNRLVCTSGKAAPPCSPGVHVPVGPELCLNIQFLNHISHVYLSTPLCGMAKYVQLCSVSGILLQDKTNRTQRGGEKATELHKEPSCTHLDHGLLTSKL